MRDAAAQCLGTCMKVVGEKFMAAYTADLDAIKLKKVKECPSASTQTLMSQLRSLILAMPCGMH